MDAETQKRSTGKIFVCVHTHVDSLNSLKNISPAQDGQKYYIKLLNTKTI